jgi:hypothetical protein
MSLRKPKPETFDNEFDSFHSWLRMSDDSRHSLLNQRSHGVDWIKKYRDRADANAAKILQDPIVSVTLRSLGLYRARLRLNSNAPTPQFTYQTVNFFWNSEELSHAKVAIGAIDCQSNSVVLHGQETGNMPSFAFVADLSKPKQETEIWMPWHHSEDITLAINGLVAHLNEVKAASS